MDIDFLHAFGDLDLKLYDRSGTEVASSTSFENHESVTWGVSAGESVYVQVYGYNGATNPRYELSIDGPEIAGDRFEPNGALDYRTYVGTGDLSLGRLSLAFQDDDFYLWTAPSTGTLDVDVLFTHAQGDIDLELLDSFGQYVTQSNSTDDDEHVSIPVRGGDQFYIRVHGKSHLDTNPDYTLTIDGPDGSELIGDTDSDGDVDLNDLNAVRNYFGEGVIGGPRIPGDAYPFDGTVNLKDLNAVRNHFGESVGAPTSAPVVSVDSHGDRYRIPPPSLLFDALFRLIGENEAFGILSPKRAAVRRR